MLISLELKNVAFDYSWSIQLSAPMDLSGHNSQDLLCLLDILFLSRMLEAQMCVFVVSFECK